jgi:branched-chain amino acid transport system substrate-binding protein
MRRASIGVSVLVLAALVIPGLTGCAGAGGGKAGGGASGGAPPGAIKIGAIVSITGPAAPLGEGENKALKMIADQVNRAGGVAGKQIDVIIEDDASDPAKAQAAASKLISQDKVVAIIGGTTSATSLAIKAEAVKAQIPQITMAAGIPLTNPVSPWVFRTAPSDAFAVQKVIAYMESQKIKKFAILHDSNAFGQSGSDQLTKLAGPAGMTITANEPYETAATDITPQLTKIKSTDPQAVVVWGTNPGPAIAARNMRELGMTQPYIASHGIANKKFIELAGQGKSAKDNPANGVVFPSSPVNLPQSIPANSAQKPVVDKFIADYTAAYKAAPNHYAGHAYDALWMLVDAVKRAGSADPKAIRDALEQTKGFVGVDGTFTFSPTNHDGLTANDLILIKIKDGMWTLLK